MCARIEALQAKAAAAKKLDAAGAAWMDAVMSLQARGKLAKTSHRNATFVTNAAGLKP